jgi:hypothetical protein
MLQRASLELSDGRCFAIFWSRLRTRLSKPQQERPMPYYVYAIRKDQTSNRLLKTFDDFLEANSFENEMARECSSDDNYFVRMLVAPDDTSAQAKADSMRPNPKAVPPSA